MRKVTTLVAAVLWVGAMVLFVLYRRDFNSDLFVATSAALGGALIVGAHAARAGPVTLAASLLAAIAGLAAAWFWMPLYGDHGARFWAFVVALPLAVLVSRGFRRRPKATGTLQRVSEL